MLLRSRLDKEEEAREPMRTLVIEDDQAMAANIAESLRSQGHEIEIALNGRDGLVQATGAPFDILIVDRMLPAIDGLTLVKSLRSAGVKSPILFLTALDGIDDRVDGLKAGGDDYLVKPFAMTELLARVDALVRRPKGAPKRPTLQVADLHLDVLRRTVSRHGELIDLQPREFRLLEYLMRHAGRIVTRTMLLENVWEFHFDTKTNIVETLISRLRAKIDRGRSPELIQTIRGSGYSLREP